MRRTNRDFWMSGGMFFLVLCSGFHLWWNHQRGLEPVRPAFPLTSTSFVNEYANVSVCHYLFRYGIFGMGKKLQQCDLLLLGSSHVEFGLSAELLSEHLTALLGHPVRVYNLGMGASESLPFDDKIIESQHLQDKAVVVDLFILYGENLSSVAQTVEQTNTVGALYKVTDLWLQFTMDWILDKILPRVTPTYENGLQTKRMLRWFIARKWATGDLEEVWLPQVGYIYAHKSPEWLKPFGTMDAYHDFPHRGVYFSTRLQRILEHNKLRSLYTLIPYDGFRSEDHPAEAQPFISISSDDLITIDGVHLNEISRHRATERFFLKMKSELDTTRLFNEEKSGH